MRRPPTVVALVAVLVTVAGCGTSTDSKDQADSASQSPLTDAPVRAAAAKKVKRAALAEIRRVPDKNLPGPKRVKVSCPQPKDTETKGGVYRLTCRVEAFTRPTVRPDSGPFSVGVADEDWLVTVAADGRIRRAKSTDHGITNFLEADDYNNCSGGESLNC